MEDGVGGVGEVGEVGGVGGVGGGGGYSGGGGGGGGGGGDAIPTRSMQPISIPRHSPKMKKQRLAPWGGDDALKQNHPLKTFIPPYNKAEQMKFTSDLGRALQIEIDHNFEGCFDGIQVDDGDGQDRGDALQPSYIAAVGESLVVSIHHHPQPPFLILLLLLQMMLRFLLIML